MVSIDVLFWLFILLFGLVGLMRGWAKELLVTFSVILALFIVTVLQSYVPFITKLVLDANKPGGDPGTVFWLRAGLLIVLTFFGYQSPNIPRIAGSGRFARERLQDALLGLFLGAVNGYLVWGTLWYFLDQAHYPFPGIVSPNLTQSAKNLIGFLPPNWLLGVPTIFFAIAIAFAFVLVVFL
jgi:uncharacterized membrane protein required for colicin V production